MTISSTVDKNNYNGNGTTTVFPYTFKILDNTQLTVSFKSLDTQIVTVQTTGFVVSGAGNSGGGNVTFSVAPDSNTSISFLRAMPLVQETDYNEYDSFPAETHELALDYLTMICQQLNEVLTRVLQFDPLTSSDLDFNFTLPSPLNAAGQYLRINNTEDGFQYTAFIDLVDYSFPSSQGILVKDNTLTAQTRTITGTSNEITLVNGSGVSGNPTISLPSALTFTGKTITGGIFKGLDLADATDVTKLATFNLSSLTTATTRTYTLQDTTGILAMLSNTLGSFAATTSSQLASVISDETGSGSLVFGTAPTISNGTFSGTTWTNTATTASFNAKVALTGGATIGNSSSIDWGTNMGITDGSFRALLKQFGGTGVSTTSSKIVVQRVLNSSGAYASGTTLLPGDDTIPQSTEGDQYFSQPFTPLYATSTIRITSVLFLSHTGTGIVVGAALFQDAGVNSIATGIMTVLGANGTVPVTILHELASTGTTTTTFKIRAGANTSGTLSLNGIGTRYYGGTLSSYILIEELI